MVDRPMTEEGEEAMIYSAGNRIEGPCFPPSLVIPWRDFAQDIPTPSITLLRSILEGSSSIDSGCIYLLQDGLVFNICIMATV